MSENENAVNTSISLYPNQINKIRKYRKQNNKRFNSDAAVFQHIVNTFFEDENSKMKTFILLYVIYPCVLCVLSWFSFVSTSRLIDILLEKDVYFNELYLLNRIFGIISFGMVGWLGASFYLLRSNIVDKIIKR